MSKYYYLSDTSIDQKDIEERNPIFSEAGGKRTLYIAKNIGKEVEIVSFGCPGKRGYFKRIKKKKTDKISIVYLSILNIAFLKDIYSIFAISFYLFSKIKYGDKVIIYNCSFKEVISIILIRIIKDFDIILEIEEFYVTKFRIFRKIYKFFEILIIKKADYFLITNREILNRIRNVKKDKINFLINFGYIDDKKINVLSSQNIDRPFILYSGRNDYYGGFDILLKSLKYIDIKLNLIITGKDFEGLDFENYTTKFVNIENKGFLKKENFEALLNKATLCINPLRSRSNYARFSFPSKIIQYFASGNIVISSETEPINQLGVLKKYIVTYPNDDPKFLAKAIMNNYRENFSRVKIKKDFNLFFNKKTVELRKFFERM
jgi:hypothetical protein